MAQSTIDQFEQRAAEAERSPLPTFLRIGRTLVGFLYVIVVATVIILLAAFVLRLLGASTDAAFTRWVYRNADLAMRPFRGIFPTRDVGAVSVLDVSLLFAVFVYVMLAIVVDAVLQSVTNRLERARYTIAQLRSQADAARLHLDTQALDAQRAMAQQLLAQQLAAQDAPRPAGS
jgi:uncharacterized protein YggT (Ycf19 family)